MRTNGKIKVGDYVKCLAYESLYGTVIRITHEYTHPYYYVEVDKPRLDICDQIWASCKECHGSNWELSTPALTDTKEPSDYYHALMEFQNG